MGLKARTKKLTQRKKNDIAEHLYNIETAFDHIREDIRLIESWTWGTEHAGLVDRLESLIAEADLQLEDAMSVIDPDEDED